MTFFKEVEFENVLVLVLEDVSKDKDVEDIGIFCFSGNVV